MIEDLATQIAGEIRDFDPGVHIDKKSVRRLDKAIKYLMVAGKKVRLHSRAGVGFSRVGVARTRVGHSICSQYERLAADTEDAKVSSVSICDVLSFLN